MAVDSYAALQAGSNIPQSADDYRSCLAVGNGQGRCTMCGGGRVLQCHILQPLSLGGEHPGEHRRHHRRHSRRPPSPISHWPSVIRHPPSAIRHPFFCDVGRCTMCGGGGVLQCHILQPLSSGGETMFALGVQGLSSGRDKFQNQG